jgi:1-acyl-sn-glycerol-3-phosphate acyltransferase
MTFIYRFLKVFVRSGMQCYFKKVKIEGLENLPKDAPFIIAPNHQNALIDPLIPACFLPIPIHYLTRSDVFNKWTNPLLKAVNMMPIYRIRDGYAKLSQNDAVFEACKELFEANQAVLIFPEGNHGEHYYLRSLSKGISRLAIQSQLQLEQPLKIVPIGLNYFSHQEPRSTVIMVVGKPIEVKEYLQGYEENNATGLISLRDRIGEGMKETLIIPEETEDYEVRRDAIFNKKNDHLSFKELREGEFETPKKAKKRSKHLIAKVLNPIPFLILKKVLNGIKDRVFYSTMKFGIGFFAFPIWWLVVFGIMSWLVGIKIAALTVVVMIMGLFFSYQND